MQLYLHDLSLYFPIDFEEKSGLYLYDSLEKYFDESENCGYFIKSNKEIAGFILLEKTENKTKKIVRTLFPKQWQNHFGDSPEDVVLLHRVKYCGNWDVLRPAKIVEGL